MQFFNADLFNHNKGNYQEDNYFVSNVCAGVKWGVIVFPLKVITFEIIKKIINRIFSLQTINCPVFSAKIHSFHLIYPIIIGPLMEEVIMRLVVQNGINKIQKSTKGFTPDWANSLQARILFTGFLFAVPHLMGSSLIGTSASISRVAFLILFPIESILFENFGFISAFIAHATHNTLGILYFSKT